MTRLSDLDNFLKKNKVDKENKKNFTHTRIGNKNRGVYGGTYKINDDKINYFWNKYLNHVIINGNKEYLTERQLFNDGPILIDIDLRYSEQEANFHKLEKRLGSGNHSRSYSFNLGFLKFIPSIVCLRLL